MPGTEALDLGGPSIKRDAMPAHARPIELAAATPRWSKFSGLCTVFGATLPYLKSACVMRVGFH